MSKTHVITNGLGALRPITLSSLEEGGEENGDHLLCPIWTLEFYMKRSAKYRSPEQETPSVADVFLRRCVKGRRMGVPQCVHQTLCSKFLNWYHVKVIAFGWLCGRWHCNLIACFPVPSAEEGEETVMWAHRGAVETRIACDCVVDAESRCGTVETTVSWTCGVRSSSYFRASYVYIESQAGSFNLMDC